MDEVAFIVHRINETGFLFFSTIGGIDGATEIGQRVMVHGHETVPGMIWRKTIQGFKPANFSETPTTHDLWIDIGATWPTEAEKIVPDRQPCHRQCQVPNVGQQAGRRRTFDKNVGLLIGGAVARRLSQDRDIHSGIGFTF